MSIRSKCTITFPIHLRVDERTLDAGPLGRWSAAVNCPGSCVVAGRTDPPGSIDPVWPPACPPSSAYRSAAGLLTVPEARRRSVRGLVPEPFFKDSRRDRVNTVPASGNSW